ncbi:hypothetical protein [Bradyrhizobium sp. CCBAU 65884]|uniref:hypothetical protein n=1 Tax=Bradyrhizobium sp. CCBAU 65884 TaxID=722477 RepID=UPI002305926B|nr:hypothetical protein [Bradyrhizobium sp. CCBAU 65884]
MPIAIRDRCMAMWLQRMTHLQIHPLAAQLPKLEERFYELLLENMRSKGQHLPIALYEGLIWDGRARYEACRSLGFRPWLVPLRRQAPLRFCIVANEERCGAPHSPTRKHIVPTLENAGSPKGRAEMRARRSRWIKAARSEFEEWVRGKRQPCAVCKKYVAFVHPITHFRAPSIRVRLGPTDPRSPMALPDS